MALYDAWCPACGDGYATALRKCTRCGANAVIASTMNTLDRETGVIPPKVAMADLPSGSEKRVRLPDTRQTQRWIQETKAYAAALAQQAAEAQQRLKDAQRDADHLANAAAAIAGLLERLGVSKAALPAPTAQSTTDAPKGRWSQNADACLRCKSTERRHLARGLCTTCYAHRGELAA